MSVKFMQSGKCPFKVIVFEDASNDSSMDDILEETQRLPEVQLVFIKLYVKMHNSYADIISTMQHRINKSGIVVFNGSRCVYQRTLCGHNCSAITNDKTRNDGIPSISEQFMAAAATPTSTSLQRRVR